MIVVAIIGILAAIAIPKFAELIRKSHEGATKGSLGALRSATSIYYADMEGQSPSNLSSLTINGKYLSSIPTMNASPYHTPTSQIVSAACGGGPICSESGAQTILSVVIGINESLNLAFWLYGRTDTGMLVVGCSHTDSKGSVWSLY